MNWKCWALLVVLFAVVPAVAHADEASQSPEVQRFEAAKLAQQRGQAYNYLRATKRMIDTAWKNSHPPVNGKLLITKIKITLDATGQISAYKIVSGSGADLEDKAVQNCVNSLTFLTPPLGTETLDLFWTFMSDGSMNMVEYTDSPEASSYYTKLVGRTISPALPVPNRPRLQGGGPDANERRNWSPSAAAAARADVDFGPYFANLQRRIKRAWFPPKGNESKRVVVVFKVHRGGELTNLRIDKSSGVAVADAAALRAVENAAPFAPLPAGASEDVDIQFTFDYNVFNGGGHATFRSF